MGIKLLVDLAQIAAAVVTLLALIALLVQVKLLRNQLLTSNQLTVMKDEREIWQLALADEKARDGLLQSIFGTYGVSNSASENMIVSLLFDHYEKIYLQHRRGAFPEELWPSWEAHIVNMVSQPKLFACWENSKQILWTDFIAHFDAKIRTAAEAAAAESMTH